MALFSKKTENQEEVKYQVAAPDGAGSFSSANVPVALVQPRISEKAGHLARLGQYVFKVARGFNKVEVKKAVEAAYKVRVTGVSMITNQGKNRNFGNIAGRTQGFKKAVVTLKKGDKIEGLTDVV